MRRVALAGMLLMLVNCSGDSDSSFVPISTALLPIAIAGVDFEELTSTLTGLDGSSSSDPAGGPFTYLWEQTAGTAVALSDPAIANPTFTTPAAAETLTFRLTIVGAQGNDTDSINVVVKRVLITAPDTWFVGYGNAGNIVGTVQGGTGPFTYEWTGVPAWLPATGTTTNTLGYIAPLLTDFLNPPDRVEAMDLHTAAQGRAQLKIKVTDTSNGDIDEDFVNFSVGPFVQTTAAGNASVGEPIFLNGGAVTNWTWTGTDPGGGGVSFFRPNKAALGGVTTERYVYFVPAAPGEYQIILTQNPGGGIKVIDITAGRYVGVGNFTGTTPDPFKGECAACHAGQFPWLADFATSWRETAHAKVYEELLNPANPNYAGAQAKGHWVDAFGFGGFHDINEMVIGWSQTTPGMNDGWAAFAASENYDFVGTTWSELKRKHVETAKRSNMQCESCHGPGSEHAGDSGGIRISYSSDLCGRCHGWHMDNWLASSHANPPNFAGGNSSCNNCHSGQGFIVEMRAQEGQDPNVALFSVGNINRPVLPADKRRGTTCQACHEPHKSTVKASGTNAHTQLRAYGNVQLRNGFVANAGKAAVCYMCHTSRTDTTAGSNDSDIRRAPHDSTAAEMIEGTNGQEFGGWTYADSPHGIQSAFVVGGENNKCLTCHKNVTPAFGGTGYKAMGGHSFAMKQGTGTTAHDQSTNTGAATVAGTSTFTVATGPSFLQSAAPGDILTITAGADGGAYIITSIDTARQVRVSGGTTFTGGAATTWSITSVVKYNTASCTQCHTTAIDFRDAARADYDGDLATEVVQDEIAGLQTALVNAINAKLATLVGPGTTLTTGSGRIRYDDTVNVRTFPGPGVTAGQNPDILWANLTPAEQQEWEDLYRAAYNHYFVEHDHSDGIHNTGYTVNLLQSAYFAVTGTTIGNPFVPFP